MENLYFAAKKPDEVSNVLLSKMKDWSDGIKTNGLLDKLKQSYSCYHNTTPHGDGHSIGFSGEQGELVNISINHFRNIATHMLNMTCSNRPSMECRATNTDYKSLVQTTLADNILEYYMREKKLEVFLRKAVEYAIVYGTGYVIMEWNATSGEIYDYGTDDVTGEPDPEKPIYEGDIFFENLSPFDVVHDPTRDADHHDWVLIRRWKNKYDLAAKYPEFSERIVGLPTKSDIDRFKFGFLGAYSETDDVQVFEFYHKKTEALPKGRYMMFLSQEIVLQDMPMPYRVLPVFRIAPSFIHGTPFGYTPMFDLIPIQEGVNSLHSTILTNQNAFGVQNILVPEGADIAVGQLAGGLNIIKYNPSLNGAKPESLNLTHTPAEIFKYLEILERSMEIISGVSSVTRGEPQASLESGTALALVQSMSLQFMSGLQQSYVELIESLGTGLIKVLQDYAATPRIVTIAGKSNKNRVQEFQSDDISQISRVVVDVGNPLSNTTAGKVQMAQELIQYGEITPKQYVNLLKTGNLDDITEDTVHENMLMRSENEAILDGETPQAVFTENHREHIEYHRRVLFDPELKKDTDLIIRVQNHIQEHIDLLRNTNPDLLMILGQQPLMPPMPEAGAPPAAPAADATAGLMMPPEQGILGPGVMGGKVQNPGMAGPTSLPSLPTVPADLLPNPALQQQSLQNVK